MDVFGRMFSWGQGDHYVALVFAIVPLIRHGKHAFKVEWGFLSYPSLIGPNPILWISEQNFVSVPKFLSPGV